MATQTAPDNPVEAVKSWLLHDWHGPLQPINVIPVRGEDADGRDAWYFVVVLPEPKTETWDPAAIAELRRVVRDKALEVGLPYPWYVVPRTEADDEPSDEDALDN